MEHGGEREWGEKGKKKTLCHDPELFDFNFSILNRLTKDTNPSTPCSFFSVSSVNQNISKWRPKTLKGT